MTWREGEIEGREREGGRARVLKEAVLIVFCLLLLTDAITATSLDHTSISSEKEGSDIFEGNEEEEEEMVSSDDSMDTEPGLELLVAGKSLEEVRKTTDSPLLDLKLNGFV